MSIKPALTSGPLSRVEGPEPEACGFERTGGPFLAVRGWGRLGTFAVAAGWDSARNPKDRLRRSLSRVEGSGVLLVTHAPRRRNPDVWRMARMAAHQPISDRWAGAGECLLS